MTAAAARLADLAAALARRYADDEDARRLAELLNRRPGQRATATVERQTERNSLICEAAVRHFADLEPEAAGRELHARLKRYAAGAFRHDQRHDVPPPHLGNTLRRDLWRILKIDPEPPSAKRLAQITRDGQRCIHLA
jgi:hypothetical protein